LKPLLRSRGDLLALVDRCCEIDAKIAAATDPIVVGRILHRDAYDLLNRICGCLTGASLETVAATYRRETAQCAAAAVRERARNKRARNAGVQSVNGEDHAAC
jgi:hypothetical protein